MLAVALAALPVYLQYNLWLQAIPPDTTYHIYAAQQMLAGQVIYRDIAIIKAPLVDFVTLAALFGGRLVGITDVTAARLTFLLIALATVSMTYLAGRVFFNSRAVGVIAALVMGGYDYYGLRSVTGPEPKALLIIFSLAAFVLIARRRWLLAGLGASLAALAWQPAAMVMAITLAAALVAPWLQTPRQSLISNSLISNSLISNSPISNLLRVLLGMALPFTALLVYLIANDAVSAARNATIGANVVHFSNTRARLTLPELIAHNVYLIDYNGGRYCFSVLERGLLAAGAVGLVGIVGYELGKGVAQRRWPLNLERTPFVLYALGFIGFTLIDFNFCPDFFPLLPVWAISIGAFAVAVGKLLGKAAARFRAPRHGVYVSTAVIGGAALLVAGVWMLDARAYIVRGTNYADQKNLAREAARYLAPGDRLLALGNAIVLVETQRANASKIVHMGSKSGLGVLAFEPGGLPGMIQALDQNPPRVITLARDSRFDWNKPFYDWVERRYRLVKSDLRADIRVFLLNPTAP